jgi:hypothetical protein
MFALVLMMFALVLRMFALVRMMFALVLGIFASGARDVRLWCLRGLIWCS